MLKQWKNNNLNVIYFHIPNSKNDEILTNDGVLILFEEFKIMDIETYNKRKSSNSGYDYELSRQSERLVKKVIKPSNQHFLANIRKQIPRLQQNPRNIRFYKP